MKIFFQVFCAVFSGILSALAIPNELFHLGSPLFAFIALVPLYIAAKNARSYKECALLFALDALSCHLLSSYWLANFKDFAAFTLGASAFGTACIEAMAGCLFFFPFAPSGKGKAGIVDDSSINMAGRRVMFEPYTVLCFAAVRVAYEWAKSTGFLAYPWGVLSMAAFNDKVLIQCADIFGSYGISFLAAFCAATLAECFLYIQNRRIWQEFLAQNAKFGLVCNAKCLVLMLFLVSCYGIYKLNESSPAVKTLNAVLVQQNADPWASSDDTQSLQTSIALSEEGIQDFKERGKSADLVVWSEAVLRYAFPHSLKRYTFVPQDESLFDFIQRANAPFIIGGPYSMDAAEHKFANAALFFDRTSVFRGYYGKSHLVPFAEVVPGVEYPWVRKWMKRLAGFSNGWTAGGTYTLFDVECSYSDEKPAVKIVRTYGEPPSKNQAAVARVGIPICFEDAFPDICGPFHQAGAEIFVNITDDSWSKTNSAEWQHFAVALFRAVEYRTTLVRSTNAGVTAVVDDRGRVLKSLPLFEEGYMAAEIPIFRRQETVYANFPNWFCHAVLLAFAVLAVFKALEFRKPKLGDLITAELLKIEF